METIKELAKNAIKSVINDYGETRTTDRQIHKEYRQSREFKRKFAEQVDKDSKIKRIYR